MVVAAACTTVKEVGGDRGAAARNILSINGEGRVSGAPDVARVDLGVSVLRDTVAQAQDEAARAMAAVLDTLQDNGVDEDDISTTSFNVFPEFDFTERGQTLRGFRVLNSVSVLIRDIDSAGDVIDDAIAAAGDVVVVNSITFTIEDPTPLLDQARELAVADARRKAEALAGLNDVSLGPVVAISESGALPSASVAFDGRGAFAIEQAAFAPTPISGGQIEVFLSVFVTYALE